MRRRAVLRDGAVLGGLVGLAGCGLFGEDEKPITPGHRIDVLPTTTRLLPDPALATRPVTLPSTAGGDTYPQPGRTPSHVAVNTDWPGTVTPAWVARIGAGQTFRARLTAPPLLADGRVYTMDSGANVDAFDAASGRKLWHFAIRPRRQKSSNVGGGITVADGTVFGATGLADAVALDAATGTLRWRADIGIPARSAPTVADGRMMFATIDQRLFALDVANGKRLWSYQAQGSFDQLLGQPAPAVDGGFAVAGFGSGELATVNTVDGSVVWSDTLGGVVAASPLEFASIYAEPVIDAGTVYAISAGGLITATDLRTGRRIWDRAVGGAQSPAVTGDWIFLLTTDQTVLCLEQASGHVRWTSVLPRFNKPNSEKQPINWSGPVLAGGRLVLVSDRGTMVLLDPTAEGAIVGEHRLVAPASMAPVPAGELLLVLTDDGRLTAYG